MKGLAWHRTMPFLRCSFKREYYEVGIKKRANFELVEMKIHSCLAVDEVSQSNLVFSLIGLIFASFL